MTRLFTMGTALLALTSLTACANGVAPGSNLGFVADSNLAETAACAAVPYVLENENVINRDEAMVGAGLCAAAVIAGELARPQPQQVIVVR
jgi:hypothetical protein